MVKFSVIGHAIHQTVEKDNILHTYNNAIFIFFFIFFKEASAIDEKQLQKAECPSFVLDYIWKTEPVLGHAEARIQQHPGLPGEWEVPTTSSATSWDSLQEAESKAE